MHERHGEQECRRHVQQRVGAGGGAEQGGDHHQGGERDGGACGQTHHGHMVGGAQNARSPGRGPGFGFPRKCVRRCYFVTVTVIVIVSWKVHTRWYLPGLFSCVFAFVFQTAPPPP